jgi:hypothetical protein
VARRLEHDEPADLVPLTKAAVDGMPRSGKEPLLEAIEPAVRLVGGRCAGFHACGVPRSAPDRNPEGTGDLSAGALSRRMNVRKCMGTNPLACQPPEESAGSESGRRIHQYITEDVHVRIGRAAAEVEDF